jgi:hypothetical protein
VGVVAVVVDNPMDFVGQSSEQNYYVCNHYHKYHVNLNN